jgi:hypothetical protein
MIVTVIAQLVMVVLQVLALHALKKIFIFKLTTPALVLVKQIKSVSQKMVLKNAIIAPQTAQLVLMKYLPVSPVQKIII